MSITRPIARPITQSIARALTAPGVGGVVFTSLITAICGNSIASQSKWGTTGSFFRWDGELSISNLFADGALRFKTITPSARTDKFGTYGYSGQTLETINADIAAQWIAPINAAGVTPELVMGFALLENDIANGVSSADMISRLSTWLSTVQSAWPSAKIILCTPRPAFTYNNPDKVAAFQAVTSHMLSLDNGSTILTARMNGYEDPGNPGVPLAGYTDISVHPNARGAMVNARTIAATLGRIGRPELPGTLVGVNITLTGTGAAVGTNVSGTKPTGTSFNTGANGTTVSTAIQPGWRITVNNNTAGLNVDLGTYLLPTDAVPGAPATISPYVKLRIVSGAQYLKTFELWPRILDGGGNTFQHYLQIQDGDADSDYLDGDVLTFYCPPKSPNAGSITQYIGYLKPRMKNTTQTATVEVIECGYIANP